MGQKNTGLGSNMKIQALLNSAVSFIVHGERGGTGEERKGGTCGRNNYQF